MDLPALPTDSLYKFVALAGLALMVFAATYPHAKVVELQVAAADAQALSEKLDANLEDIEQKLTRLKELESPPPEAVEAVSELNLKSRLDKADVRRAAAVVKAQAQAMQYYVTLCIVSLVLGVLMAMSGFGLWYLRIQKPMDRALGKNAARAA